MSVSVNLTSKLLKSKSFVYNQSGSVHVKFIFENDRTTDLKLISGDYILITYMDSTLKLIQDKCTIQSITYAIDEYTSRNEKILTINLHSKKDGYISIKFSAIYDISLLSPSTLYEGSSISDDTTIANSVEDIKNPKEGGIFYVNTNIVTNDGIVLPKGLYKYIDGDFITTESTEVSTEDGDYRVLDSVEEMEYLAAYEGLMVSVPVTKPVVNLVSGRAIEGIRFGQINNIKDGIIIEFKDITKSIIAYDGKIYYKCDKSGAVTDNSILLYDGEEFTNVIDSEHIYWFPADNIYISTLQSLSFTGVVKSHVVYQYNNGEWVDFAKFIQNPETSPYITSAYIGYSNKGLFPSVGKNGIFYIDYSTSIMYIWNSERHFYEKISGSTIDGSGTDVEDVAIICCGTSDISKDKDISGLISVLQNK